MKDNKVICGECGFRYDGEQKLCPMCGSKKRSSVDNYSYEPVREEPVRKKQRNPKILGGIVIITAMILMMMGFMAVMRSMMTPIPEPAPEPTPEADMTPAPAPEIEVPALPDLRPEQTHMSEEEALARCEAIMQDYIRQMEAATPRLIEEFKAEAEGQSDGRVLAHIHNKKVGELAELCNAGLRAMWDVTYAYEGLASDRELDIEDYEFKLDLVYQDEAMKLSDVYTDYFVNNAI